MSLSPLPRSTRRPHFSLLPLLLALLGALASLTPPAQAQQKLAEFGLGRLYNAAYAGPGKLLTAGARDVILWGDDGVKERIVTSQPSRVAAMACSADGKFAVTGGQDSIPRLWSLDTSATQKALPALTTPPMKNVVVSIQDVDIATNGSRFTALGGDGFLRIYDARSTEPLYYLQPTSAINAKAAALAPDGSQTAFSDYETTYNVRMWDITHARYIRALDHGSKPVTALSYSPDGKSLLTGCDDKLARIWNVETGATSFTLTGHGAGISGVDWSPDGAKVLTMSAPDRNVRIWSAQTGQQLHSFDFSPYGALVRASFSDSSSTLMLHSADGVVRMIDLATGAPTWALGEYWGGVTALAFAPDGNGFLVATDDRRATRHALNPGQAQQVFSGHQSGITAVAFSPDGRKVLTSSLDKTARVHRVSDGALLNVLKGHASHVTAAAFAGNGKVMTGSDDKSARLWDLQTSQPLFTFSDPTTAVTSLAVSADGLKGVVGDRSGAVNIYNLQTGSRSATYANFAYMISSLAISPGGTRLLIGGVDATTHTARLVLTSNGATLLNFKGHRDDIAAVAFSPDGRRALTAGYDCKVKLWNALSGYEILSLNFGIQTIASVAFSPDGTRALTGGADGIVRLWDVSLNGVGLWDRFN